VATYYIDFTNGLDTNNGLGPDASHATNKPWKTLGKATNTGATVAPGDTVYVAPGTYYSTLMTPIAGIASSASPTSFRGDPTNAQGFKTSGGVRVAPGLVWLTTRTAVEGMDSPIASTNSLIVGATNGTNGLKWYDFVMEVDLARSLVTVNLAANADWSFTQCRLIALSAVAAAATSIPTAARNMTFTACTMVVGQIFGFASTVAAATADANLAITVDACFILGRLTISTFQLGTSAGNKAGGIQFRGCTILGAGGTTALTTVASVVSTVTPLRVAGCLWVTSQSINAGTLGHVVDDGYNRFITYNANTNFTQAGTSFRGTAAALLWPDVFAWGLEMAGPMLGWGPGAVDAQRYSAWSSTAVDFRNRTPRPWGPGASIGYVEYGQQVRDTTSAVTGGGADSLKITGGGEVSLFVAVDPSATTLSVVTKSTTYGGTNYPQLIVVANPEIGLAADITATATSATEQTLTAGPFTPTVEGVVEVRLVSRSTSVTSASYFDILAG
jgi:hypothetical protein